MNAIHTDLRAPSPGALIRAVDDPEADGILVEAARRREAASDMALRARLAAEGWR